MSNDIRLWKEDAVLPSPGDPSWDQKSWPVDFIETLRAMCHEIDKLADYLECTEIPTEIEDSARTGYDEHIGDHIQRWNAVLEGFAVYRRIQLGVDVVRIVESEKGPMTIVGPPETIDIAGKLIAGLAVDPAEVAKIMLTALDDKFGEMLDDEAEPPGFYV